MSEFLDGNTCVVGLQWGDEGKGKIVDFLTENAEVVARYCGGANAGHSVRIGNEKYATHLLPVGVFRPGVMSLIGNGVVLDPVVLFKEIDEMVARGVPISPANLRVSYKAHLVMPYHQLEDAAREAKAGAGGIGTTKRGIGPAYADKMHRTTAFRVADLLHEERLKERLERVITDRNTVFKALYDAPPLNWRETFEQYRAFGKRIEPYVDDVGHLLIGYAKEGKRIVFEGAHAVLLDVDHGTYPYVTSSNCSALGLYTGAGVPPQTVKNFFGIMKAYSTRVGGGPFPTEQENATGQYIRERGNEYGTTTRRPRRCGWFDAMAVRYSVELCGITHIALTLLDVLSGLEQVKVCTGYMHKGIRQDFFRADMDVLAEVEPIYETFPGWKQDISQVRRWEDLPPEAKSYVQALEKLVGAPIRMVSVGPERTATLIR
ncbi:adenylosuccinate synthase [Humisphaera borealis]|uniref:Adenylosuccinate synthetase n=1 Tax=Humisphaera borealis TaxID=2807512 RepID=A0A7M2WZ42_9BACT|nr:adenylosuccinate synthase [Humisphaera borealis]QOV90745.1 adenylosuccinate synthase [Humisphaera borealis]